MAASQLPPRPSLDQLKRQAKDLLRDARRHDPGALVRFRTLPQYARATQDDLPLALHDAQSVIARDLGFDSWNALREHAEELTLAFDAAVAQFIEAATDGRTDRAERLLALHPAIVHATFHTALLLGDLAAVERGLAERPALAVTPGGPREWEPLLYVCHTSTALGSPDRGAGLVAIARRLIALGADPNARFPWLHHGVRRPVLWGAARATRLLPLVELLLEAGANRNDGVTLPLSVAAGDLPVLERLVAHGADVNQPWTTDGSSSLYAALTWAKTADGVRWLLEHGADPDPVFAENGETPMHVVARSWGIDVADALARRGANLARRRADGRTPYAIARLNGNQALAEWLLQRGASDDDLSDVDRLVAAGGRGDRAAVDAMLAANPTLTERLGDEHYAALYQAAERGDVSVLESLLACGLDPNHPDDSIGKTALHVAAMEGGPDALRVLLAHGASVTVQDREFHAQPLVWAAEGSRMAREGRDHVAVGRLLLAAGSPVTWKQPGSEPAEGIYEILEGWSADRT
jgi:ankyrin repeat protein